MVRNYEKKAELHWSKVRDAVFGANREPFNRLKLLLVDKSKEYVKKHDEQILTHGVKLIKEVGLDYVNQSKVEIKQVIHHKSLNCYHILFTDGNLCKYNDDLDIQEVFCCKERVVSICFADKFKSFVAVCADNNLRILDQKLDLINTIPFSGALHGIIYSELTHEIITFGKGSLIIWIFRTSGTLLIPKLIITDKILPNDSVTNICLEETSSENQRCFSVVENCVLVHKLSSGSCIQSLTGIHDAIITNVLYFRPRKRLITSSKDGCIKLWNEDGSLHCIFVGHFAAVTSLALLPTGPRIISTSQDETMRIWNLETNNETDCQKSSGNVKGVVTCSKVENFFSFTKNHLQLWKLNNLYSQIFELQSKVRIIKTTTNPRIPPQSYCICDDGSISLISLISKKVLSVFNVPGEVPIKDAVYHISENLMIVLLNDCRIIEVSTKDDHCSVESIWDKKTTNDCRSISLYEYMPETSEIDDEWNQINKNPFGSHVNQSSDKTLLFGGSENGTIIVFEWKNCKENGSIVFRLQAHTEEVIALSSNPKMDQLASTSKDKTLKVWRVFPFAEEALTPLLLFDHSMSIDGIGFSNKTLCVIYQDIIRAYYTIGMYRTSHKVQERCVPQDIMKDHTDIILSLTTCPKLGLVASSSKDGTLHIRNNENDLLCKLKLSDVANSISFCSQRGNLLIAIGKNIHMIHHKQYLPTCILENMVGMKFIENKDANDSFPLTDISIDEEIHDDISKEEQERRNENDRVKQIEFANLEARDKELHMIRDGNLKAKKYTLQSGLDKDIAFQRYLDFFYRRPDVPYPEDDPVEDDDRFVVKVDSSYRPPPEDDTGFFSVQAKKDDIQRIKEKLKKCREEDLERRKLSKKNSDLEVPIKKLRSLSIETDEVNLNVKNKRPKPPLSASTTYVERLKALKALISGTDKNYAKKTLEERIGKLYVSSEEYPLNDVTKTDVNKRAVRKFKEILSEDEPNANALPVAPDGIIPNSVVIALYKELRRESVTSELKSWKPFELSESQLAEINEFNSRKTVKKVDTPPPEPLSESESWNVPETEEKQSVIMEQLVEIKDSISENEFEDLETPPVTPPKTPSPPPPPVVEKEPPKRKPIMKFVSTAVVVNAVAPPKSPSPPPPLPLPHFVLQFKEEKWYKQYFPDLTGDSFQEPHTIGNFVRLLLQKLKVVKEYDLKSAIMKAILLLFKEEEFEAELKELVQNKILGALSTPVGNEPSSLKVDQLEFIKICLQLLLAVQGVVEIVVVELMVQFILGSPFFRKEIMKTFDELGLQDSKDFFPAELHTFDVSLCIMSQQRSKLHELSLEWITLWMKNLRQHISSLVGKIGRQSKGNNVRRNTVVAGKEKSILKKTKDATKSNRKSITFDDKFVGEAAKNITPIDAINYFCEMKFQEELEQARKEALQKKLKAEKDKNTILHLPKIDERCSLVRLGETHKSICHPERETSLARVLPPIPPKSGVRSLLLHLNTLKLSPFPDELDELVYAPATNSNLLTLRYSQKYFVHSASFV